MASSLRISFRSSTQMSLFTHCMKRACGVIHSCNLPPVCKTRTQHLSSTSSLSRACSSSSDGCTVTRTQHLSSTSSLSRTYSSLSDGCTRTRTQHLPSPCMTRAYSSSSEDRSEPYTIRTEENGIRRIFLNDPKKRNALSLAMLESLKADLNHESDGQELRVIILSAGGPVFSSGHNLKELTQERGRSYHVKVFETCSEVMMLVQDLPVPVIAQVQGLATAAGCQLVASCDIAIASDQAKFATPGVNVGLFCSTPGVALGRAVPRKLAMEMLFTGHPISAQVALQHGLVSRIVPHESLENETMAVADRIVESSRSVIALGKACFNSQITKDRNSAYRQAGDVMVENLALKDGQEGIQAFVEKRKPTWRHTFDR